MWSKAFKRESPLPNGQRGGYTVFLLGGIVVTLMLAGLALDYANIVYQRQKLRAATDAAVLAASRTVIMQPSVALLPAPGVDSVADRAKAVMEENLKRANFREPQLSQALANAEYCFGDPNVVTFPCAQSPNLADQRQGLTIRTSVDVPTMLLRIIPGIQRYVTPEVSASMRLIRYKVALVFDITGSAANTMGSGDCPGCAAGQDKRIDWLKYSANRFLDQLLPFDQVVLAKVATTLAGEPIMNEPASNEYWNFYLNDAALIPVNGQTTIDLVQSDGTSNLPDIKAQINSLVPTGITNLGAAIRVARNELAPWGWDRADTQLMMVVISDGVPYRGDQYACWKRNTAGTLVPSEFGVNPEYASCMTYPDPSSGFDRNMPRRIPYFAGFDGGDRRYSRICRAADGSVDGILADGQTVDGDLDWLQKLTKYDPLDPWKVNKRVFGSWFVDPILDADNARDNQIIVHSIGLGAPSTYDAANPGKWWGPYQTDNDKRHDLLLRRIANDQRRLPFSSPDPNTQAITGMPDFPCTPRYAEIVNQTQGRYFPANSGADLINAFDVIAYEGRQRMMN